MTTPVFQILIKVMGHNVYFDVNVPGRAITQEVKCEFIGTYALRTGIRQCLTNLMFKEKPDLEGAAWHVERAVTAMSDEIAIIDKELNMLVQSALKDYQDWVDHMDKHAPPKHTKFETGIDPFSIMLKLECVGMVDGDSVC